MDPLSDVLSLLKHRSYMSGGFDNGGDWSIRFERHEGIKCYALVSGHCWLAVDGVPDPVRLESGDCFLLPGGRPFTLAHLRQRKHRLIQHADSQSKSLCLGFSARLIG